MNIFTVLLVVIGGSVLTGFMIINICSYIWFQFIEEKYYKMEVDGYKIFTRPQGWSYAVAYIYEDQKLFGILPNTKVIYSGTNNAKDVIIVSHFKPDEIRDWYKQVVKNYLEEKVAWDKFEEEKCNNSSGN